MGASDLIKSAIKEKGLTQEQFAEIIGRDPQQVRNLLYRDTFRFSTVEEWLNAIGFDIVLKERMG